MRRPPPPVALVARTHWLVGAVIAAAMAAVHFVTRGLPIAFGAQSYAIAAGLSLLYALAGTLVWFGLPPGAPLGRICALLYLIRPGMGMALWRAMNLPEYRAHFLRPRS